MVRPFLKWAGGKRQLLPTLSLYYPATFDRYVEPFLGSGAVFFDLCGKGLLGGRRALLSDSNADLIGCYQALRDHTDAVIVALERLEAEHRSRGSACYYDVREHRFNPARAGRVPKSRAAMRGGPAAIDYTPELAAMFIYLNRTGFNGLFRLNRRGAFNVPAGRYVNPRICDSGHLRTAAAALQMPGVSLSLSSFEQTLGQAGTGDFVYCDPPYAPLSRTSLFAHYTAGGFTMVDHRRLYTAVVAAAQRGAAIVMSNSSAAEVVDLYRNGEGVAAGLSVDRVKARRAINSRATLRGPVDELVISNTRTVRLRDAKQRMLKVGLKQGTRLKAQGSRSNSL